MILHPRTKKKEFGIQRQSIQLSYKFLTSQILQTESVIFHYNSENFKQERTVQKASRNHQSEAQITVSPKDLIFKPSHNY